MEDLTSSEKLRAEMIRGFFIKLLGLSLIVWSLISASMLYLDKLTQFLFDLNYLAIICSAYFILEIKNKTELAVSVVVFGIAILHPINVYQAGGLFSLQCLWGPTMYYFIISISVGRYQTLASKILVTGVLLAITTSYLINPENLEEFQIPVIEYISTLFLQVLLFWYITKFRQIFSDDILDRENLRVKLEERQEVLRAAIVTYNHEIRNPLAIAMGYLQILGKKTEDLPELRSIQKSLDRIEDVLQEIESIKIHSIKYESYDGSLKMLKIKK